ncbi:ATP synthase subunit d, mitochondrial [Fopius arisanus]|uniref:ATP synthase subunit d, mitochondrial n=2 Tax=Fopius arisanus TaxID=64838 RepID=A0A9R1TSV1_9HYME|nr:PREDICTED: ATP synthase subunit d, mitochondrial-like [Fopius arisanus]
MAARRAIKTIDWAAIAARINENDRAIYAAFKSKSDGFLRRMEEFPESVPAIDWAFYKKNISGSMVDSFQKEYDSLQVPYPADKYTATVEQQAEAADQKVKAFIADSNKQIADWQGEITRVQSLIPFEQMTMEDFAEAYPQVAWNPDKPTLWPHIPEYQPGDEPEKIPEPEH